MLSCNINHCTVKNVYWLLFDGLIRKTYIITIHTFNEVTHSCPKCWHDLTELQLNQFITQDQASDDMLYFHCRLHWKKPYLSEKHQTISWCRPLILFLSTEIFSKKVKDLCDLKRIEKRVLQMNKFKYLPELFKWFSPIVWLWQ